MPARRGGVDDAAVALVAHELPGRLGDVEGAAEVHVEHRVHLVGRHVLERRVAQDAGVVDDDVDLAEGVDGRLHDRRAALGRGDAVVVGDGLAAGRLDLVDDLLGGRLGAAGAVGGAAEVVDDDERAPLGEVEGVRPAEAAAGARDDRHLAVEPEISHVLLLRVVGRSEDPASVGGALRASESRGYVSRGPAGWPAGGAARGRARRW